MDIKFLIKFLSENERNIHYVVTLSNGDKMNVRLFLYQNFPCMCRKRKRCGDYIFSNDIKDWIDIRIKNKKYQGKRNTETFSRIV